MICVTQVKVHPDRLSIKTGQAYTRATAQVSPRDATNPSVKWSSSNPKVVNVHPYNGTIFGVSEGTATVYATAQDDSGKRDCCTVIVSKRIPVRDITLSFTNIDLGTDVDYSLPVAKVSPDSADDRTVRWCSDNPDVATIKNGRIYTHLEGKATLTAAATDGSGVSASCKVNVYKTIYVSSVTLSASNKVMRVGESVTLSAEVCPDNATNRGYMWLSSDESIATVNPASGLVIAQKPGTTTICAESVDGSGKKGVCTVTVKESIPVDSITFDRTNVFLRPGDRYEIFKVICPSNATNKSLLWTSTDPDVASINNGVIRAKSNGVTTIIAVPADGGGKPVEASCSVWVSDYTPVSSVTVSPSSKTMTVGDSITLHATVCPEDATNRMLEWRSSDEKVVTVHRDSGYVFAQGPGTAIVQALTLEGMGVFGSCQITVKAAVPVRSVMVCPTETSIRVGESTCLTATVYPKDATNKSVRWSSDRPDIATVSKTGTATAMVTGRSNGTATITAMTADGGFVSSCRVTVDSREVVYIVKDEKNINCFEVQFSDGLIWKNFGCGLSGDTFATLGAKNRYSYNCTQLFNLKQLSFIYLVDPLGVAYYVKTFAGDYDANVLETLLVKDDLYEKIFGIKPRFFEVLPGNTIQAYYGTVTRENREKVYSEAEILFGAHTIPNIAELIEFTADVLITICAGLSPTVVAPIVASFQLLHALFFSSSVKGLTSGAAFSFLDEYISGFGEDELERGSSKMLDWANILLDLLDTVSGVLALPDFKDITIYNKVDSWYYNVQFKIKGSDYSMKDIISRYEMDY